MFSNFYPYTFTKGNHQFFCAEQAIMYEKATLFGAHEIAQQILNAKTQKECKALGRSRKINFDQVVWDREKERIFKSILFHKFYGSLRPTILDTGNLKFVEASPYDKIWGGCGLSERDPKIHDEKNWTGQNLLGKCLDEVRAELRKL